MDFIEIDGKEIKVIEIERIDWDCILYKSVDEDRYYIFILLNHSAAYYTKTKIVDTQDVQKYLQKELLLSELVNFYK
jgi:hypothetical protein